MTESAHVTRADCIYALRAELVSRNLALALARERIRALEDDLVASGDSEQACSPSPRRPETRLGEGGPHGQPSADGMG